MEFYVIFLSILARFASVDFLKSTRPLPLSDPRVLTKSQSPGAQRVFFVLLVVAALLDPRPNEEIGPWGEAA